MTMSSRLKKAILGLALGLLISSILLLLGHGWYQKQLNQEASGLDGEIFEVPTGVSIREVAEMLETRDLIGSSLLFRLHLRMAYPGGSVKAGEYRFEAPITIRRIASKLVEGRIFYHRITVPEGLDHWETASLLGKHEFFAEDEILSLIADPAPVKELDPEAANLEGYLFPETYLVARNTDPDQIIEMMVSRFHGVWKGKLERRAEVLGMSVREVVTLASLIEKETSLDRERPLVSSVFHNRLKRGMKLACDPTVIYAVKLVKSWDGIIHQSDLDLDSPYNTYLYPGLPPGPIANPGLASIEAALYPAETGLLYFVSRNDGSHIFSENYREHQSAVRKYQR